jgi:hypothetical protein
MSPPMTYVGAVALMAAVAAAGAASAEPFLRIDGVAGDSPSRPGWIDVEGYCGGTMDAGPAAALFADRPTHLYRLDFTLADGAAARRLAKCGVSGCRFAAAAVDDEVSVITFKSVLVRATGASGDAFTFTLLCANEDADTEIK